MSEKGVYVVMRDNEVIRMFETLDEAISFLKEFPYEERREFEIWKQVKAESEFKTIWRFVMSGSF